MVIIGVGEKINGDYWGGGLLIDTTDRVFLYITSLAQLYLASCFSYFHVQNRGEINVKSFSLANHLKQNNC